MPQYGGDLVQSAPNGSAIRELQVPTIVDRDRLSATGVVRVNGRCYVDADGVLYQWNGVAWLVVPSDPLALQVATNADKATIPTPQLTPGDVWLVDSDGTTWTYTGTEAGAPDPSLEDAWDIAGPARDSWFSDPLFPTADSRTIYLDAIVGSDVFSEGTTLSPFATIKRGLDSLPENGEGIPGLTGFGARVTFQYQGGAASKANLQAVTCKFAKTTPMAIDVLGEQSPVDLDGLGTTEFAADVYNRDLSGPLESGGTVVKNSQYRLGIGVNVLASVQQPTSDGDRWIMRERSFGFPGLRYIDGYNNCRVHDELGVMGPQDIGLSEGFFNFGLALGDSTFLSDYVTQVDASLGFSAYNLNSSAMPRSINLRFIGIDFATDMVAEAAFNRQTFGNYTFEACKIKVGGTQNVLEMNPNTETVFGRPAITRCTVIGESAANNGSYIRLKGGSVVLRTAITGNVFINAALCLGDGRWDPYMNIFRGVDPALGNNGNGGRLFLGTLTPNTDRGEVTSCSCFRVTNDWERAPGEALPMRTSVSEELGACVIAIGAGTSFQIGGSQGFGTIDATGKAYHGVFGAEFIAQNQWRGEVTRPALLRTGARAAQNQYTAANTGVLSQVINVNGGKAAPNGGDVQLGFLPAGSPQSEIVLDWADLPATDVAHGLESEAIFWR